MVLDWGLDQLRYVPWLGIEPITFWYMGWYPNQLSHLVRANCLLFLDDIIFCVNSVEGFPLRNRLCGDFWPRWRHTVPPHTTKRRTTTNLKTKNNQNWQKIELYGSLTTKELKKKLIQTSKRGRDGQPDGKDSRQGSSWRTRAGKVEAGGLGKAVSCRLASPMFMCR